jgi:hypothetical protein
VVTSPKNDVQAMTWTGTASEGISLYLALHALLRLPNPISHLNNFFMGTIAERPVKTGKLAKP